MVPDRVIQLVVQMEAAMLKQWFSERLVEGGLPFHYINMDDIATIYGHKDEEVKDSKHLDKDERKKQKLNKYIQMVKNIDEG